MPKIPSAPSPTRFSAAWAEEFESAVKRAAGRDGRLSKSEAQKMANKTDGDQFYADDALAFLTDRNQQSVSVAKLVEWAGPYALAAAARVSGSDGRVSFSDAQNLPPTLREDFYLLRGRALSDGPASELDAARRNLNEAVAGLLMPSETDAELKFVFTRSRDPGPIDEHLLRSQLTPQHDAILPTLIAGATKLATRTHVEQQDADAFLLRLSTNFDPNDPDSVARAQRFADLHNTLKANLTDLVVFRFGERNISTFIVGRTRTGELAGLLTGQVET